MRDTLELKLPGLDLLRDRWNDAKAAFARWALERERERRIDEMTRLQTPWQRYWGDSYRPELKRWLLRPVFARMEAEGKVGNLIVDIGSGACPVSRMLGMPKTRRRILVDVAALNGATEHELRVRLDVERAVEGTALSCRKAAVRIWRFLGETGSKADLIVFSDVLNYVDFRKVLGRFSDFLRPGGRFLVVNLPMKGNPELFSEVGLTDNRELFTFLAEAGFEIEEKTFPCRAAGAQDEAEELLVLIARKPM
jgi:SAM-dependent methyltransferase